MDFLRLVGDRRQWPLHDDKDRLANMIRQDMRGGLVNSDLEDMNKSPFTPVIRQARKPLDFKLPTLEMYDERTDPAIYLTTYMRHMEVLEASEKVMAQCFPLYLTNITTSWYRQLESGSISTWTELIKRFMRQF